MSHSAPKTPLNATLRLIWFLAPHAADKLQDKIVQGFGKGHQDKFLALSRRFLVLNFVGGEPLPEGEDLPGFLLRSFSDVAGIKNMGQFTAPDLNISFPNNGTGEESLGNVSNMVYALCPKWHKALGPKRVITLMENMAAVYLPVGVDLSFITKPQGFAALKEAFQSEASVLPVVGAYDPDNQLMIFFDREEREKMISLFGITIPKRRSRRSVEPSSQPL